MCAIKLATFRRQQLLHFRAARQSQTSVINNLPPSARHGGAGRRRRSRSFSGHLAARVRSQETEKLKKPKLVISEARELKSSISSSAIQKRSTSNKANLILSLTYNFSRTIKSVNGWLINLIVPREYSVSCAFRCAARPPQRVHSNFLNKRRK